MDEPDELTVYVRDYKSAIEHTLWLVSKKSEDLKLEVSSDMETHHLPIETEMWIAIGQLEELNKLLLKCLKLVIGLFLDKD